MSHPLRPSTTMLVPVACAKCTKPFQVPESAIGQMAECPWCQANVPALPVAAVLSAATAEPLPLDDEPPPPPAPASPSPITSPPRSSVVRFLRIAFVLLLLAAVFGFSFAAMRYCTGWLPEYGWKEFAAPDGSCKAVMPASITAEETYEPVPDFRMTQPGKRFTARDWFSNVATSVGWVEIDRDSLKMLRLEDLTGGEIARRKKDLNAVTAEHATVKRGDRDGVEVRYRLPGGVAIDRMILVGEGPRPRLYVLSYTAPALPQGDTPVTRFFDSFQIAK